MLVIFAGIIIGWIRKGSLLSLTNIRLKGLWILPVAYLAEHVSVVALHGITYELTIVCSYVALLAFCLLNLRVQGVVWTTVGTAANFLVMVVNGLRMPAYMPAVKQLDPTLIPRLLAGNYGKSIAMSATTHLNFLGDIFPFYIKPASLISIGDILFAIGFLILVQHAMCSGRVAPARATGV